MGSIFTMMIPCFSDNSTSDATTPTTSTDAPPPTDTPSTGATPPTDTSSTPHTVTTHTDDISSLPPTLTTPTSNTDATFSNLPPSSPSASSTVSQVVSVKSCTTQLICSHKLHANTSILSCMLSLQLCFVLCINCVRVWHGQLPQGIYIHTSKLDSVCGVGS